VSGRLAEVGQHLATTRELGVVVGAMRSIAAARVQEARQQLDGVRAYAETLGTAIGEALALLPEPQRPAAGEAGHGQGLVLALCAEQGFVGGFNERVLDAALACRSGSAGQLWLLGERGGLGAQERGLQPDWTAPMAVHLDEVPALAGRLAEALYARLGEGAAWCMPSRAVPVCWRGRCCRSTMAALPSPAARRRRTSPWLRSG